MHFELTKEFLEELKTKIADKDEVKVFQLVRDLHPADLAEIYKNLDEQESKFLYLLLDHEKAADMLLELEDNDREKLLNALPGEIIARQIIGEMDSDDAADVLGELSEEKQEEVLQNIADLEHAGDIVDLLHYKENTAGGLMAKEVITVNENWDIVTCIREMRKQAEEIDELYYVYVIDDDGILKGTLSLKRMLLTKTSAKIKNIQNSDIIYVKTDTPSEEVAQIMEKYDLVSLPVVDAIGRLLGRITIDDVVDVIREEAEKDYQMISGITEDVESTDKVWLLTRARLPWLLVGLVGGVFGSLVIANYELELELYPQMAFFVPLVAAMGGNAGVQSSSIIVQSLASNSLGLESTFQKLLKELGVSLINGFIMAALILLYSYFATDSLPLTLTVSSSLLAVIICASLFGTFIPLALNRFKIDPALATGPFITTFNDILGLFIYFVLGRIMYAVFL
ncbi:MAG: magnesium transporter [Bacteroidota bacterium]